MKKVFALFAAVILTASVFAQTPEKMSYQAVIRNSSDVLVKNTQIGMKISILQGSASGTAVYVETQTPTTNANGLVSIEIGGGTVVSGTFGTINWSGSTYFIKTETDPAGGTNYTITGTSQLLSVPYALHAKTAGNGFSGNYNDLTNKPTIPATPDGSETKLTAGTNVTITGSGTTASPYLLSATTNLACLTTQQIDALASPVTGQMVFNTTTKKTYIYNGTDWVGSDGSSFSLYIGKAYQGGKIAYILQSGDPSYDANVVHGLIVAPTDYTEGGTTKFNWNDAKSKCDNLELNGYTDWYLPSKKEWSKIWQNKNEIGGTFSNDYWSSSEDGSSLAWAFLFDYGYPSYTTKDSTVYVRAVRAF